MLFFITGLSAGLLAGVLAVYFAKVARLDKENASFAQENARLTAENSAMKEQNNLLQSENARLQQESPQRFKEIASQILEEKSKGLDATATKTMAPLKDALKNFSDKVDSMERRNIAAQGQLQEKLENVIKSTTQIDQSAIQLTNAIKGEAIVRGRWGEESLKRILDMAGMKEDIDYFQQISDDGKRVDVQIALPNDRWIVVDAKTLFNHYERYFNEQDPKEKEAALDEHVKEMKNTIKDLSGKKYYKKFLAKGEKVQPDYTLMFVYPESALLAAVEKDPSILSEAWTQNIALVSATSLMSTLKMVCKLWDIDKQNEYMDELKEDIVKLMEKFNEFLVNFAKAEAGVIEAADKMRIARGHIDKNSGSFLPVAQRIVDVYEVPMAKNNARLLKKMDYAYNGAKNKKDTVLLEQGMVPEEKEQ